MRPSEPASRRVLKVMLQPTGHCPQIEARRRQLPRPRAEAEVRRGQRAHRADVGRVSREDRIKSRLGHRDDPHRRARGRRSSAPGRPAISSWNRTQRAALDAALLVQEDQLAQRHVLLQVHLLVEQEAALARARAPSSGSAAGIRRPCRRPGSPAGARSAGTPPCSSAPPSPSPTASAPPCRPRSAWCRPSPALARTAASAGRRRPAWARPVLRSISGRPTSTRHMRHMPTGSILG